MSTPRVAAEWVPIEQLKPWAKNPRQNDGAVPAIAESIKRFGFVSPVIVWDGKDRLVAGHTRVKALAKLLAGDPSFTPKGAPGPGLVPVRYHAFASEEEADLYAIADNRLGEIAGWDETLLIETLGSIMLRQEDAAEVAGFDDAAIAALLKANADAILADADAEPEPEAPARFELVLDCPDEATRRRYIVLAGREGVPCRAVD